MPIHMVHEQTAKSAEIEFENKRLREELQRLAPTDGAHLVVNGEIRKIGKKSQYLLDMLTLPEDK